MPARGSGHRVDFGRIRPVESSHKAHDTVLSCRAIVGIDFELEQQRHQRHFLIHSFGIRHASEALPISSLEMRSLEYALPGRLRPSLEPALCPRLSVFQIQHCHLLCGASLVAACTLAKEVAECCGAVVSKLDHSIGSTGRLSAQAFCAAYASSPVAGFCCCLGDSENPAGLVREHIRLVEFQFLI
jgi:hypothetical protein